MLAREAEVEQLHAAGRLEHDVLGLDVPVHEPGRVRVGERLEQDARDAGRLARRERAALEALAQRLPGHVLECEEGLPLPLAAFVEGRDRGVLQAGRGARLEHEPLAPPLGLRGIERRVVLEELERHAPAEGDVEGEVHVAHAALAQPILDEVVRDGASDHGACPPRQVGS